jgi:hypothetical protein
MMLYMCRAELPVMINNDESGLWCLGIFEKVG